MGIGLNVSCPGCGTFMIAVGPSLAQPDLCLFPFICTECEGASCLDAHSAAQVCEHCGSEAVAPYGNPRAVGELGTTVVFACSPCDKFAADLLTLTDGIYWCPTCHEYTARFSDAGVLWD